MFNFDDASKKSKEAIDTALKGYTDVTKGFQAIATETAEYSKKSFQDGVAHIETLVGVKSIETAIELQSNFVKSYYESLVSEATKLSEMYADLAKTVYKPYEAPVVKTTGKAVSTTSAAA